MKIQNVKNKIQKLNVACENISLRRFSYKDPIDSGVWKAKHEVNSLEIVIMTDRLRY